VQWHRFATLLEAPTEESRVTDPAFVGTEPIPFGSPID